MGGTDDSGETTVTVTKSFFRKVLEPFNEESLFQLTVLGSGLGEG